jgi:hypothetical protein
VLPQTQQTTATFLPKNGPMHGPHKSTIKIKVMATITTTATQNPNTVYGKVTDADGRPMPNIKVEIYDVDIRNWQLLSGDFTGKEGKYDLKWTYDQLTGRERKSADIAVKVFTREKGTEIYKSPIDEVRFNASSREEINIIITAVLSPEQVEYDYILSNVTYLADNVAITELQESKEYRDLTFLSKEAEIPVEKIEHLIVAHRLQGVSQIDPAFFYALLRKNTLLKNDFAKPFNIRLAIDINTDTLPLLYEAALTDEKIIQQDINTAIKEMIVSSSLERESEKYIELLRQFRQKAEEFFKNEHPKKLMSIVSRFVLEDRIGDMAKLFEENKDNPAGFLNKLNSETFFKTPDNANEARASVALEQLLGFEDTLISEVRKSNKIKKPEDLVKLARLNKAAWREELNKLTSKGQPVDKTLIDFRASSIVRKMERAYPTAAFAAQLERDEKPILNNQKVIADFLTKNEDFDLRHHNISVFLKKKKVSKKDSDLIREELKSVQRIFKLVPHYGKTNALREMNIKSSYSITAAGEVRFVNEIAPKAGIAPTEAKEIFKRAERTSTAAMLMAGELQDTIRVADLPAMEMKDLALKLEAVSEDFPNLKSLFKLTDTCSCEHCRSVYSPAAYLVEILQFLDKRTVKDLTVTPNTTSNLAKDVLFERRPDLGDIDLGCENANTPVPYIDLVCELLEEAIAPDAGVNFTGVLSDGADPLKGVISAALLATLEGAGLPVTDEALIFETETTGGSAATLPHYLRDTKIVAKIINTGGNNYTVFRLRQTLSPADELAAAPEYVNAAAYTILSTANYAFKLPFDLNHAEAKAYFTRFDISRAQLMRDFQSGGAPSNEAIATEKLGLTDAERNIIVTSKANLGDQQSYWNAPAQWDDPPVIGNVLDYMTRVDHVLDKTSLSYKDLDLLLTLSFIDPADNLFIRHLDLSCDTAKKEVANLDLAALDRIHRFLRLQKKTGWKIAVLDEVISQPGMGNGNLDDACLVVAANLLTISEATGIKIDELIGFYGDIPHTIFNNDAPKPLYYQVFLNKAKNGFIDEGMLPEVVDGSQLLANFTTSISVCLQIKEQDLNKLLPLLPDGDLNFANLSSLYAAARLIKKMKIKVDDFIILIDLTGINPSNSIADTLDFIDAVNSSANSPLKLADVEFMLQHEATNLADREIKDEKITLVLEKLQKEYQANFATNKSRFNAEMTAEEQKEPLQMVLSRLPGVSEEDVKTFIKFIDRDWTSANGAKTFTDNKLIDLFDTTSIKAQIDALNAAPGPDISTEQNDLVQAFFDTVAAYQLQVGKQTILEQSLATTFKADPEAVKIVLKYALLKQPAPGTAAIFAILSDDALIDTDPTHTVAVLPAITSVAFPDQYRALRLSHKMYPLINAFKLQNQDLDWFFRNNNSLGWFEWDSIPYEVGQVAINYSSYIAFAETIAMLRQFAPVPNPQDIERPISFFTIVEMLLPASGTTRNQFIEAFSLLTGYDKNDIDAIDAHLFPVFNLNNYRSAETWKAVVACAEHMRRLGTTIVEVQAFLNPVLTGAETRILRTALKVRYDEDTWLSTLKEIMSAIRPQKRDALVAYLMAENPEMQSKNDLYDYFLVDVEMESCMPSSRIVQAHGAVQLFVQRCLMGLEQKAAADVSNDKAWEQWKWMKNYRVWEANRKVFVYPENWIEAELRDDKSFLFTELENEIQQNELTEFTAEQALTRYLEKLDNIAFLEVAATWYQSDIKTMHVFARTKGGDPAIYYYRRFEKERYWTPWEKVELDISGDHLLAFVRNNRLCLAWPIFSEEPDPNPASTIPSSTATSPVPNDKPKRKLKIQLAMSEFANKKWQPKKISKDGILTPDSYYTSDENWFKKDIYNIMYFEPGQQVWFFTTSKEHYSITINGIFNIAGCKGYPELAFQGEQSFPDFFPDFKDTWLKSQRYTEQNSIPHDELAVRNAISFFGFYEILTKTPGIFRLSYPHQFTLIDLFALLFEYLIMYAYGINSTRYDERRFIKIPLGTLLPYFKEDSKHAYVIVPGFYSRKDENNPEKVFVQRTGSDTMQLLEDIVALLQKYMAKYAANPDINALLQELIADPDYQKIVDEIKVYGDLSYGEQFKNMYHPLICALRKTLYKDGIAAFMKRETQLQQTPFNFGTHYDPNTSIVPKTYTLEQAGIKTLSYPVEDLDFSSDGSYSGYNWELFFHIPFLLATRLTRNQRFEEALTWFHYMFNPTGALEGDAPEKYWVTKPFYLTHTGDYINQRIDTLLYKIADPSTPERKELEFAIDEWRTKPFKPHVVARFRPVAYQKALLMKYIDNLTEWGDYLFRQDTMESIVQATQMYILADKLLGPKPRIIPATIKPPYETYNQIEAKLDAFGNALIDLENILPDLTALPEGGDELPPAPITLSMLYFCIPHNDKMLAYWDRIADRLFKIRHCQNIDGVERSLALFAPPIDPGMLVKAAASGLDISSVIAGINAPMPYYRFVVFAQKATELASDVKGLGLALLGALEKKDAEAMSLLQNEQEVKLLNAIRDMKVLQIKESKEQVEILRRAKATIEEKHKYYAAIQKIIAKEQLNLDKLSESHDYQMASQIIQATAGVLALIPDLAIGASGFGGSPHAAAKWGGTFLAHSATAASGVLTVLSTAASYEANRASILGNYDRRFDDWKLQERMSKKELAQIDKQIAAAEIRREMSETDLKNHDIQIENSKKAREFMRTKFTNQELCEWIIGQISSVYFKSYQLAHDFAKKAERCYRFELGNDDTFISFGYWDSMKKGLQSADHLIYDLKRMQTSYLEKNKREYEITRHVSLTQLDPLALVRLIATGVCDFEVPEVLYDMDHPGHYFRRIKSVAISVPCVAGPYTSVSAKLSLISNRYRSNTNPDNIATTGYLEDPGNDERFIYNVGAIQSIATSNAQNDNGMFELNFKDERYLVFEGCGAVSSWRLELPNEIRQFDYNTISDVILHIKYTAREGGSTLRGLAEASMIERLNAIKQQLGQTGLHIALNMKHDLSNEWLLLKNNGTVSLTIDKLRLPYIAQTINAAIENVMLVAKVAGNPASFTVNVDGAPTNLSRVDEWQLCRGNNSTIELDTAFNLSVAPLVQLNNLEELMLVVKYSF